MLTYTAYQYAWYICHAGLLNGPRVHHIFDAEFAGIAYLKAKNRVENYDTTSKYSQYLLKRINTHLLILH
jgi:hypothetical protein